MKNTTFQIKQATFEMDDGLQQKIEFLGPNANTDKTHITLIAGANGTSKSRILASLVDRLCEIDQELTGKKLSRRYGSSGNHELACEYLETQGFFPDRKEKTESGQVMPSKVLVLSNLVMDRFRFVQNDPEEDQFYKYLGVRQASNLMTTGSMTRSVSEALMGLYRDDAKRELFQSWVNLVFGQNREVALTFDRLSRSQLLRYVEDPNRRTNLLKRLKGLRGRARSAENLESETDKIEEKILQLFQFLLSETQEMQWPTVRKTVRKTLNLRLDALPKSSLERLSDLYSSFSDASRAGFGVWPSVSIEGDGWRGWNDFSQLSSGEQNILSTGAKLIAHAEPGCLIAIDEPEVSLNTSWQQHYTDLVRQSLTQAPGSHVLIATHSPHLISSLPNGEASVILIEKLRETLKTSTVDAQFEGWGAEAVLYQVLDIPSASSFKFQRDLALVLRHIQAGGKNIEEIDEFLEKADRLNFDGIDALTEIIVSIRNYRDSL